MYAAECCNETPQLYVGFNPFGSKLLSFLAVSQHLERNCRLSDESNGLQVSEISVLIEQVFFYFNFVAFGMPKCCCHLCTPRAKVCGFSKTLFVGISVLYIPSDCNMSTEGGIRRHCRVDICSMRHLRFSWASFIAVACCCFLLLKLLSPLPTKQPCIQLAVIQQMTNNQMHCNRLCLQLNRFG